MKYAVTAFSVAFFVTSFGAAPARSQALPYPTESVRLIVPFPAGGTADIMARLLAQGLSVRWSQTVIVDNRPGATGSIAAVAVKRAKPDGYTLLIGGGSVNTVPEAFGTTTSFETVTDFAPISNIALLPNLLVAHPSLKVRSVAELITLARTQPGKINFGSSGVGSAGHLAGELFKIATGTELVHVPYKGSAPAVVELMSGQIQLMFDNIPTVLPLVRQGSILALGTTSLARVEAEKDIPAISETLHSFEAMSWVGILAPAGTPPAIVQKISTSVAEVLNQQDIKERLSSLGAAPSPSSPDEFKSFLASELQKWKQVISDAKSQLP